MSELSDPKRQRATGLSIVAIIILLHAFLAVLVLRLVQPNLGPVPVVVFGWVLLVAIWLRFRISSSAGGGDHHG
jgi:hypothetical protein